MGEFFKIMAQYAPVYVPLGAAIATIVFTKAYVYKGMVPETFLSAQLTREKELLADQVARERTLVEGAKNIENRLEELVRQLESQNTRLSELITGNNARITSLERFLSDQIDAIRELSINCEKHRKGIPDTAKFQQERGK